MHLLITRPTEDADVTIRALKQQGHSAVSVPLLTIEPVANLSFDLQDVQGLVITSANGIRAFAQANEQRDVAIFAVGQASAHTASALGFTPIAVAQGDVPSLARLIEERHSESWQQYAPRGPLIAPKRTLGGLASYY